jgi:hypothetical protein
VTTTTTMTANVVTKKTNAVKPKIWKRSVRTYQLIFAATLLFLLLFLLLLSSSSTVLARGRQKAPPQQYRFLVCHWCSRQRHSFGLTLLRRGRPRRWRLGSRRPWLPTAKLQRRSAVAAAATAVAAAARTLPAKGAHSAGTAATHVAAGILAAAIVISVATHSDVAANVASLAAASTLAVDEGANRATASANVATFTAALDTAKALQVFDRRRRRRPLFNRWIYANRLDGAAAAARVLGDDVDGVRLLHLTAMVDATALVVVVSSALADSINFILRDGTAEASARLVKRRPSAAALWRLWAAGRPIHELGSWKLRMLGHTESDEVLQGNVAFDSSKSGMQISQWNHHLPTCE